ncbi:MAG: glycosyltransferase family 4 protein [Armatimonadota bacterium]|nr:glycosyltransferase family 4 protein [Armatimonadota bacterium]MDR7443681.1 glycosyltransferase family 4 protein [Armatimonadota bacterium]MDR7570381.1 glycosyltransferase family 4 protein [Armatimonadota bacterium]MDR7613790.1 glycosyltransferase family 4 protein [Armatimonadota bacterium]
MEIAILHYTAPPVVGGVEAIVAEHARLLRAAGYRVRILAGRGGRGEGTTPMPLLYGRHPEVRAAHRALERGDPHRFERVRDRIAGDLAPYVRNCVLLVHNVFTVDKNLPLTAALHRLLDRHPEARMVAWTHDLSWADPVRAPRLRPEYPWSLLRTPRPQVCYVAISEAVQRLLVRTLGLRPEDVSVIPPGVSLESLHPLQPRIRQLVNRLRMWERFPVLLAPVRITRRKNLEMAVRITAALRAAGTDPLLVVTGPPGAHTATNRDYLGDLKALRDALGLGSHCVFLAELGLRCTSRMIGDLYFLADAVLLTSVQEGFGLPVAEAALARVPVFCTAIPATEEVAGPHARFFRLQDPPEEIARRILTHLTRNPQSALRRRVLERFTWDRIFRERMQPLLDRLLRSAPAGR